MGKKSYEVLRNPYTGGEPTGNEQLLFEACSKLEKACDRLDQAEAEKKRLNTIIDNRAEDLKVKAKLAKILRSI